LAGLSFAVTEATVVEDEGCDSTFGETFCVGGQTEGTLTSESVSHNDYGRLAVLFVRTV
jgi:hypothetical protein